MHEALVTAALGGHGGILLGAMAAYYKYGDRTESMAKSLQGTEATLRAMRGALAGELAEELKSGLRSSSAVTAMVDPVLGSYSETAVDIFSGEQFRSALVKFVERKSKVIVDCRSLAFARDAWARRARRVSWCLFLLIVYETICVGALFSERLEVFTIPDLLVKLTFSFSVALILVALATSGTLLMAHDQITAIRMKHEEL